MALIKVTCQKCGCVSEAQRSTAKYCTGCLKQRKRERNSAWRKTDAGRASRREYKKRAYQDEEKRAKQLACQKRYYERNKKRWKQERQPESVVWVGGVEAFEAAKDAGELEYCPRMCVKMKRLPCGERGECWTGKRCERVHSKGVKLIPKSLKFNW